MWLASKATLPSVFRVNGITGLLVVGSARFPGRLTLCQVWPPLPEKRASTVMNGGFCTFVSWRVYTANSLFGSPGSTAICGLLSLLVFDCEPGADRSNWPVMVGGGRTDMSVRSSRCSRVRPDFRAGGVTRPADWRRGREDDRRDRCFPKSRTNELNFIDANLGLENLGTAHPRAPTGPWCSSAGSAPRQRECSKTQRGGQGIPNASSGC